MLATKFESRKILLFYFFNLEWKCCYFKFSLPMGYRVVLATKFESRNMLLFQI